MRDRSSKSGEKWAEAKDHLNDAAAAVNKAIASLFKQFSFAETSIIFVVQCKNYRYWDYILPEAA